MFSATARLSSLPRLGLRLPLRAVQAHTHSHTATATVSGVRVRATREREVVEALGRVQEPLSCQSLHHIAAIQSVKVDDGGAVHVELDFFVPGYPKAKEMKINCEEALKHNVPWITDVSLSLRKGVSSDSSSADPIASGSAQSLRNVKHIIGVSSCKGGVGKSTTAVNLACTLAKRGLAVGLLDADVYGPSLPYLLSPDNLPIVIHKDPQDPKAVMPLIATVKASSVDGAAEDVEGVIKFLSFGHVNPKAGVAGAGGQGAAVIRGPIVSRVINQLIANTSWGNLDYLIVDMPPGTGDIQITLNQSMSMTGSVIVTTPHPLAVVDVLKGRQMMESMHVPTLALVENMSHFTCDLGTRYFPFGQLDRDALSQQLVKSNEDKNEDVPIVSFPLTSVISSGGLGEGTVNNPEIRRPITLYDSEQRANDRNIDEVIMCYDELADTVIGGVFKIQLDAQMLPQLTYNKAKQSIILRYYTATEAIEYVVPVIELRIRDAATGLSLPQHTVSDSLRSSLLNGSIYPTSFDAKGNYGVGIVWSDGHYADIYPFSILKSIADECKSDNVA